MLWVMMMMIRGWRWSVPSRRTMLLLLWLHACTRESRCPAGSPSLYHIMGSRAFWICVSFALEPWPTPSKFVLPTGVSVIFFCWVYLFKYGTSFGWMNFCWLSGFDWLLIEFKLFWFLWHVRQDSTSKTQVCKFSMTAIFRRANLSLNDCLFVWVFDCS